MRIELELPSETRELLLEPCERGATLSQILRKDNLPLNTRCGERNLCRACLVEVLIDGVWQIVRGCQYRVLADTKVRVPAGSILAYNPQVQSGYRINVSVANNPLFSNGYTVVADIGTTTVAVSVVESSTGKVVQTSSGFNRQMHLGDDVLTRINLCLTDESFVGQFQSAIVAETLNPLVLEALSNAGLTLSDVSGFVFSGNTTMLHLVAGVNPGSLGYAPFTPSFINLKVVNSREIGLVPPNVEVYLLPGAAAYVGSDITSGVFASGLVYDEGPSLLVDVGTNGELVLKVGDHLYGCATAAGPAFEGSGLLCGVRAGDGAISHLTMTADPFECSVKIIGGSSQRAHGICGSAYVDFLAEARSVGILQANGRMRIVAGSENRFSRDEYGLVFQVIEGIGKRPIVISEPDVASLIQAKAAIAAGIEVLLSKHNLGTKDVKTLYLAGGFGMHLNLDSAIRCGMFPGFDPSQIQLVGNTSLAGALLSSLDKTTIDELSRTGKSIEVIELNLEPEFEDIYIDQLTLD